MKVYKRKIKAYLPSEIKRDIIEKYGVYLWRKETVPDDQEPFTTIRGINIYALKAEYSVCTMDPDGKIELPIDDRVALLLDIELSDWIL